MRIKEVEQIFKFSKTINHINQIDEIVEEPLIEICKYLYNLNIPTTMTSANIKYSKKDAYIIIDYDLLSEENRIIIDDFILKYPNNFQLGKFSTLNEHNEVNIFIPINESTDIRTIQSFFWNVAKSLKMQEVYSFVDADTYFKNIYNISDMFFRYLECEKNEFASYEFQPLEEIENFLNDMGYIKIKTCDFNSGHNIYNGYCEYLWINNSVDNDFIPEYKIYEVINRCKQDLFGKGKIKRSNLNYTHVLSIINKYAQTYYNEKFFFNEEDNRFYLNEELLLKHKNYLQYKQQYFNSEELNNLKTK